MPCCKCEEHSWKDPQAPVWTDPTDQKEYCVFHAPAEHKLDEKGSELSVEEFNKRVFERIDEACSWHKDFCKLYGTVFPGDISFERYNKDNPLPDNIYFNKAEFRGEAMFFWTTFGKDTHFDQAKFHKAAAFYGATFSRFTRFVGTEFNSDAWFDEATFGKNKDSEQAEPGGHVNFYKATFGGDAKFNKAKFNGEARFEEVTFSGNAGFEGATFSGDAEFEGATFGGEARFNKAMFDGDAGFEWATFSKGAGFEETKFFGKANFGLVNFAWPAWFMGAEFHEGAKFFEAKFDKDASFIRTEFTGEADFQKGKFSGVAMFTQAIFDGQAKFGATCFAENTTFLLAKFKAEARYDDALFQGGTFFDGAVFDENASFDRARFKDYLSFGETKFKDVSFRGTYFAEAVHFGEPEFNGKAEFQSCSVKTGLTLDRADMENVPLYNVPIESFRFTCCEWPPNENGREIVCDEKDGNRTPKELEDIYRRLKRSAKETRDELMASAWHWNEKEHCRKRLKAEGKNRFLRLALFVYRLLSGYGERPLRALVVLFLFILSVGVLLASVGIKTSMPEADIIIQGLAWPSSAAIKNFWILVKTTLENVLLFKYNSIAFKPEKEWAEVILFILSRLLVPIQAALFAFALRNKFRR